MRVVLITGASKGIGLATAERLAKEGYKVYATTRKPDQAHELQALAKHYENIIIQQLDVTDEEETIKVKIGQMGVIDILINNAGVGLYGPVETATDRENRKIFEINVFDITSFIGVEFASNNSIPWLWSAGVQGRLSF